jgi:hypothetical protein
MQFTRPKIIFLLIILILFVTIQVCLLEQVMARVTSWTPHKYQDAETHEHEKPTPSQKHDEEEHQAEFCCDNSLNLYVDSPYFISQVSVEQFFSLLSTIIEPKNNVFFNSNFYFQDVGLSVSFRARDKYALTCLSHAPPRVLFSSRHLISIDLVPMINFGKRSSIPNA